MQLIIGVRQERPAALGFLFFAASVALAGLIVILIVDLTANRTVSQAGKLVHIDRNMIAVVFDDNKLRRYRIFESEVLAQLRVDQRVTVCLTWLTRIPVSISVVEQEASLHHE